MENKKNKKVSVEGETDKESQEMDILGKRENIGYQKYCLLMSEIELDDDEKIDTNYFIDNPNFQRLSEEEKIAFLDAVNKRLAVIKKETMIKAWIEGFRETIEAEVREEMKKKSLKHRIARFFS